jgi:hypothetical protein
MVNHIRTNTAKFYFQVTIKLISLGKKGPLNCCIFRYISILFNAHISLPNCSIWHGISVRYPSGNEMSTYNYKSHTDKEFNAKYKLQRLLCPWTKGLIRTTHSTFPRGHILLTGSETISIFYKIRVKPVFVTVMNVLEENIKINKQTILQFNQPQPWNMFTQRVKWR